MYCSDRAPEKAHRSHPASLLRCPAVHDLMAVDRASDKFLQTPQGKLSVIEAITRGVKTDDRGGAFEARDRPVLKSMLITMLDTVSTAEQAGWQKPANISKAAAKTAAAEFILVEASAGREVTLHGVRGNLYVHADGSVLARMRPVSVCRTRDAGAAWVHSVHPVHGEVASAWPLGIRSSGPWQVRSSAGLGNFWPVMSALSHSGHTGMSQIGRLLVSWEPA
jgi:hypothetical protein